MPVEFPAGEGRGHRGFREEKGTALHILMLSGSFQGHGISQTMDCFCLSVITELLYHGRKKVSRLSVQFLNKDIIRSSLVFRTRVNRGEDGRVKRRTGSVFIRERPSGKDRITVRQKIGKISCFSVLPESGKKWALFRISVLHSGFETAAPLTKTMAETGWRNPLSGPEYPRDSGRESAGRDRECVDFLLL